MKTRKYLAVFALSALLVSTTTSCSSDDDKNNGITPTVSAVLDKSLAQKFPSAKNINWQAEDTYYNATFTDYDLKTSAWFEPSGTWVMTETDITLQQLPDAIKIAFNGSKYAQWKVDDVEKLERAGLETVYVLELEQNGVDCDLYYNAEGILIREVLDGSNTSTVFKPVSISDKIQNNINSNYKGAKIYDIDYEDAYTEVNIIYEGFKKELTYSLNGDWAMTETEINYSLLPETIKTSFNQSQYSTWETDDIYLLQRSGLESVYVIEVEKGDLEYNLYFSMDGTLLKGNNQNTGSINNNNQINSVNSLSEKINSYINTNHTGARIYDIDYEKTFTEVDIIENGVSKELVFDPNGEWVSTKTSVNKYNVPQIVSTTLVASIYATYVIEDIDYLETTGGNYYKVEVEKGDHEVDLKITLDGKLTVIEESYD